MRILAIDPGDARTGVACCDEQEMLASPVCVIHERNRDVLAKKIAEEARSLNADQIIVGHPINMNGTLGERSESSRQLAAKVSEIIDIPVLLWDERCTTVLAADLLNCANVRGQKRKNIIDAVAAVVMLENYMSYRKNKNAPPSQTYT
jgi:putative Holliday junction resolvase